MDGSQALQAQVAAEPDQGRQQTLLLGRQPRRGQAVAPGRGAVRVRVVDSAQVGICSRKLGLQLCLERGLHRGKVAPGTQ
jgi:hypothetical protein